MKRLSYRKKINYKGVEYTIRELADVVNLSYWALTSRIKRHKDWSIEKIVEPTLNRVGRPK